MKGMTTSTRWSYTYILLLLVGLALNFNHSFQLKLGVHHLSLSFCKQKSSRTLLHQKQQDIEIYDNVFLQESCQRVDTELTAVRELGHTVYQRDHSPRSLAEVVIEEALKKLNDNSKIVEYWWRDEWINLDFHRDLDESLWRHNQTHRCPKHGHVLYLSVGSNAHGPTVILHDSGDELNGQFNKMTIVPPRAGRLLRFSGHLMHGVPRPSLAYFDPSEGGSNTRIWTRIRTDRTNPDDPELTEFRRSVLLFNTWDACPMDVKLDVSESIIQIHSEQASQDELKNIQTHTNLTLKRCSLEDTNTNTVNSEPDDKVARAKFGLLGDLKRRERPHSSMSYLVSPNSKKVFLDYTENPQTFHLFYAILKMEAK